MYSFCGREAEGAIWYGQKDTKSLDRDLNLKPEDLLAAYAAGVFPMADPEENDQIFWYAPDPRAILPLDGFRIARSLRSRIRKRTYTVSMDSAFSDVIKQCANRSETWISEDIIRTYEAVYEMGYAHSVESWLEGRLVGGLYGVTIKGAFFGESMFSVETDASKVALVHLVETLKAGGFQLLDIQFLTDHLSQFGAVEISRSEYEQKLEQALQTNATWNQ